MDVIKTFDTLPVGKYTEALAVSRDESLEEIDKQARILAILADTTEDEVLHLPLDEYRAAVADSRFLSDASNVATRKVAKVYKLGGWTLVPLTDFRKIETAQYIDFQTFAERMEEMLPQFLSVILVPKGHRYNDGYDITELQEVLRTQMVMTDALSLVAFFLVSWSNSITDSLNCSTRMAKGLKPEQRAKVMKRIERLRATLRGNGVG